MPPPRAVLFDAYGTLFDVHGVAQAAEALFPGAGARLSALWRQSQIDYTRLVSMAGRYEPFSALTRAGLRHAAAQLRLPLDAAAEARLLDAYRALPLFAGNRAVLADLQQRGVATGILSNGDPAMLDAVVAAAGIAPLLRHVVSVDAVRRYKPDPACYALGTAALGLDAGDVLFVSSNGWDALGATWFGYATLWVDRGGSAPEQIGPPPTRSAPSLAAVLDFF